MMPGRTEKSLAWSSELVQSPLALPRRDRLRTADLDAELAGLATEFGDGVYSEWVNLLCRLRFSPEEAIEHWQMIVAHKGLMEGTLGSAVDSRVALIHSFLEIHPRFESPIVNERNLFEEARESGYRDELTGLRDYRLFVENLEHEVRRSSEMNRPLSLVMFDIDDFEIYDDRNGHQEGNRVLAEVAGLVGGTLRMTDGVARFGGEEFSVVLPATPKPGAEDVAERLRGAVAAHRFRGEDGQPGGSLIARFGVATFPADARSAEELVRNADRALYVAKARGKNLVEIYRGNRRSFPRLSTRLTGSFSSPAASHDLTTLDVGTGGLRFETGTEVAVGSLLDIRVHLPDGKTVIGMAVRVVGVTPAPNGRVRVSARTIDIERRDLGALSRFLNDVDRRGTGRPDVV